MSDMDARDLRIMRDQGYTPTGQYIGTGTGGYDGPDWRDGWDRPDCPDPECGYPLSVEGAGYFCDVCDTHYKAEEVE